jgi:aspartate aminotransferase-like enzyme
MFGPNAVPNFSHRDEEFKSVFKDFKEAMRRVLSLNDKDEILFVTGSGTLANEIVLSSCVGMVNIKTEGTFSKRLFDTSEYYGKEHRNGSLSVGVQFETGECRKNDCTYYDIVDGVSALPYYEPEGKIFTTVLSKQFGFSTGTSLICIRDWEDNIKLFKEAEPTYLSLKNYIDYSQRYQTPNTPAIDNMYQSMQQLQHFDVIKFRKDIKSKYHLLKDTAKKVGIDITQEAPVACLRGGNVEAINILTKEFELYTRTGSPQLFLWSSGNANFEKFIKRIGEL